MAVKAGLHNNNNKGNYYRSRCYDYSRKVAVVIAWESSKNQEKIAHNDEKNRRMNKNINYY